MTNPPNHHAGGNNTTINCNRPSPSTNRSPTPLGIRRCAGLIGRCPPEVSAITVITIYVAAEFDSSGSSVEEWQRNGENVLPQEYPVFKYGDYSKKNRTMNWRMVDVGIPQLIGRRCGYTISLTSQGCWQYWILISRS
eukprot:scaffold82082_cov70-Cyclotella_meneghiniana.AAC.1